MGPAGAAAPGTGWPGDPATPRTPVAGSASQVVALARSAPDLAEIEARESVCRACPRLVAWREDVARTKRAAFAGQEYWGRPAPGWGDARPTVLIVGLAPAAHGANRTGRVFTGDRSGDWLFASLFRAGMANRPRSVTAGDGLALTGARVVAAVRCAPPANKPTPKERDTCAPWLDRELELVGPGLRAVVALGGFAWDASLAALARAGARLPSPKPRFGHGAETRIGDLVLLGSYHPSQQNTFTGRLTEPMLDAVLHRAAEIGGVGSSSS
jgi:uracil-DNA glycosylase